MLHAMLNYADASTRRRYRRKSGHQPSGRIPREDGEGGGRGRGGGDTYKCALNINPFELVGATSSACPFEPLGENFPNGESRQKYTEVRCRKLKNIYLRNVQDTHSGILFFFREST